ncbi:response regulator [Thiohalocapsa marina]|uniref:Response regulator n=1 Tax=Thiohalocapsa marina TaxID=424902 RepID=A0A5M8FT15_9GAMM|nr:response regulator [Thiohalocapsa marina]KAA6186702.1 response regulator [Thiohalocapsa marina]
MPDTPTRILIIDDQPTSVGLLLAYLADSGLDLLVALNGEDGLRIAREGRPDLILLDVHMPSIDGFSLCRQLKAQSDTAQIPVIFLSAAIETEDKLQGFAAGGVDYITKPFSAQEVLARVFVQLGEQQQLKVLSTQAMEATLSVPSTAFVERRERRLFTEAVTLLTRQLTDPPNLVELARRVGTNKQRLTQIFRQQVGMSAFEYLQELRLERGRSLLRDTDLQVQLIAEQVGYRNAGDFTRAFRRHFGVTPRQYRQGRIDAEPNDPVPCDAFSADKLDGE